MVAEIADVEEDGETRSLISDLQSRDGIGAGSQAVGLVGPEAGEAALHIATEIETGGVAISEFELIQVPREARDLVAPIHRVAVESKVVERVLLSQGELGPVASARE